MHRIISALACIVFLSCSVRVLERRTEISQLMDSYNEYYNDNDTLNAEIVRRKIISEHPLSKETYDFAVSEFYENIHPVWSNDSAKVELINDLMNKYPKTPWRRTMYRFLTYSLSRISDKEALSASVADFKNEFPSDYLSFVNAARYYYIDIQDTVKALDAARRGFELSFRPEKPDYYPDMEWQLEKRSALVAAGSHFAEILTDVGKHEKSLEVLDRVIGENLLSVNDENTLARIYYLKAKALSSSSETEPALEYLGKALIEGDSRNIWQLCEKLYMDITGLQNASDVLEDIRDRTGYSNIRFSDVTAEYGLDGIRASRVAWSDYDNDGYQDLLLDGKRLFKNISGEFFYEITSLAFPEGISADGALWGDFNNNGSLDFVTKNPEAVWLNDKGVFRKVTGENSITDNGVPTEGIGIGDLNRNGFLDIYFANYETSAGDYEHDLLFFGAGEGSFIDLSGTSGIIPEDGKPRAGRGVSIADHNNNGYLDIFVSNYRLSDNFLFVNDGKGYFVNEAVIKGLAGTNTEGWWGHTIGSEWGDLDNNGLLDLVSANLAHPRFIDMSDMTMVYKNPGTSSQKFTDIRNRTGIRYEETHSEPALGDLNNNGHTDIYFTSVYEGRRSFLYANKKNLTFEDITYLSGTRKFNGWGVAFADFDNDGKLDMIVAGGESIKLFKNTTPDTGNWLQVWIRGKNHSDGIGTRLRLFNDNISLTREVQGGKGSTNQHSLVQHFGLGPESENLTLEIRFPLGEKRTVKIENVNRTIVITE